jgi:hypothetical protein
VENPPNPLIDGEATEAPEASLKSCTQKRDVKLFRGVFFEKKSDRSFLGFIELFRQLPNNILLESVEF